MKTFIPKLNQPTDSEIEELQIFLGEYCLSAYAPYIPPNSDQNPNRTQIRNLIKHAHKLLREDGLKERQANKIIQQIKDF